MGPQSKSSDASPELQAAIEKDFGSMAKFQQAFEDAGAKQFGSGWAWLVYNNGKLEITTTANQDNPVMTGANPNSIILGNDLWEHAYYLTYRNKRADYLKNWWKIVNWKQVSDNFSAASR